MTTGECRSSHRTWALALLLAVHVRAHIEAEERTQQPDSPPQTVRVAMRDGVRLATYVYLPRGEGPFPVILARTPYGIAVWPGLDGLFTSQGYAFVAQDSRGRFGSEGKNLAFEGAGWAEGVQDGADTLAWVARQSWCDGKIGTTGDSAVGINQYLLAGTGSPELTCQHVRVAAPGLYRHMVYPGGVFAKALVEDWLRTYQFDESQLAIWTAHSTEDSYWEQRDLRSRWEHANVPAVHVSGWYDFFVRGTIEAFVGYQTLGGPRARGKQKLVLGAWDHGLEGNKVGEVHLPAHAATPPNQMSDPTRWFDHWLKGMDNGVEREPAVTYYVMGDTTDSSAPGNVWRTTDAWPPRSEVTPFYLHTDQSLSRLRPTATDSTGDSLEYKYDPQDPVPTLGGQNLTLPSGPWDQRRIETRPDVLTFSSDRLDQAMEITGGALAVLWVGSDRPDTDFVVRLCDVYPDGRSLNICEGILRARFRESFAKPALMKPSEVYRIEVALGPTSIVINRGHRLRVQVTSSNAPACDPNPNTGLTGRADDGGVVARNRIFVDARRPSHIQVPVVPFCQSK